MMPQNENAPIRKTDRGINSGFPVANQHYHAKKNC